MGGDLELMVVLWSMLINKSARLIELIEEVGLGLDEGVEQLFGDGYIMEMKNIGVAQELVEFYKMHKTSIPDEFPYELGYIDVEGCSNVPKKETYGVNNVEANIWPIDVLEA
ncbi:hypothetical protein PIB30_102337 [Stylosanthes scabra]|uniref:Uncharacterized protein n=1 Tax=Stylosanthes scabra TaxID=79078 RepID=A0ABU6TYG4_9FABA|nr:hypothetical protein [Stylosanthes scabra]